MQVEIRYRFSDIYLTTKLVLQSRIYKRGFLNIFVHFKLLGTLLSQIECRIHLIFNSHKNQKTKVTKLLKRSIWKWHKQKIQWRICAPTALQNGVEDVAQSTDNFVWKRTWTSFCRRIPRFQRKYLYRVRVILIVSFTLWLGKTKIRRYILKVRWLVHR